MTILENKAPVPPKVGKAKRIHALLAMVATVVFVSAAEVPPARAESTPPVISTAKHSSHSEKSPRAVAESAQTTKQTAAQAKPRPRVAPKSAKQAPAPAAKTTPVPAAKPSKVMAFDADEVEGQRLEPGYELIQASPRRARHPSMVSFPPKPEDSIVQGD